MPSFATQLTSPVNTGNFDAIATAPVTGSVDALVPACWGNAYFRNDSATAVNLVVGVTTAGDAATASGNFQHFQIPGTTAITFPIHLNPATAYVRSTGAAHSSLYMVFNY